MITIVHTAAGYKITLEESGNIYFVDTPPEAAEMVKHYYFTAHDATLCPACQKKAEQAAVKAAARLAKEYL